jgi:hypothetical protein
MTSRFLLVGSTVAGVFALLFWLEFRNGPIGSESIISERNALSIISERKALSIISEKEALSIIDEIQNSPLTGGGAEAEAKLLAFREWHKKHDSDPFEESNAARLRYLQNYWRYWENPRLLDDIQADLQPYQQADNWIYQETGKFLPEGDMLRAVTLQAFFVQFHFSTDLRQAFSNREKYVLEWELNRELEGPPDIHPIRWVIRNRKTIISEGVSFHTKYSAANGWREKAAVLDAVEDERAAYVAFSNEMSQKRAKILADSNRRELDEMLKETEHIQRMRAVRNLSDTLRFDSSLQGIEQELRTLNRKIE